MGTNYYARLNPCKHCNRSSEEVHLGKASGGCRFHLNANRWSYYKTWNELKEWLTKSNSIVVNEYEEQIPIDEFIDIVEAKQECKIDYDHVKYPGLRGCVIDNFIFYDTEFG